MLSKRESETVRVALFHTLDSGRERVRERPPLLHGNTHTLAFAARPYFFWESYRTRARSHSLSLWSNGSFLFIYVCVCVCCLCNCFFSGQIANWLLLLALSVAVAASAGVVVLRFLCFSLLFSPPPPPALSPSQFLLFLLPTALPLGA